MLLDIDHIAFSSLSIDRDIEIFQNIGYKIEFIEKDVENLSIKRSFLRNFSMSHDIALLRSHNGFNIEFLNHRNSYNVHPYMIPIFENLPLDLIEIMENGTRMKVLNVLIHLERSSFNTEFKFNKLMMYTDNSSKTKKFFEIIGFRSTNEENGTISMEFRSLFGGKSYFLFLKQDNNNSTRHLDDNGPNCIALLSNSIEHERKNLSDAGFFTTPIQRLTLNEKIINIFFTRGPSNEIVEIISIERNSI